MKSNIPGSFFLKPEEKSISHRQVWAANRFRTETENMKTRQYGGKSHHHWYTLLLLMKTFRVFLKLTGFYNRGLRNAEDIALKEIDLFFPNLPSNFESFRILHISDPHLDGMPGLEDKILRLVGSIETDLCVLTGDYRTELHGPSKKIMKSLKVIIDGVSSRYGFLGVLGNHDDYEMVAPLEDMGIRMLINETCLIEKNGDHLQIIGTDDPHYYYTDQAVHVLENADTHFSIALVHTPELYEIASNLEVDLYLCGHSHGGQICLPGGIPIIRHLNSGRKYYRGHWNFGNLQGITNSGVGTSGIPIRFWTRGEVLLLNLHRKEV